MTIIMQYPVSDFAQGPYNFCIGRFEVYFNPLHPDSLTPGRREGPRWCDLHTELVKDSKNNMALFVIRLFHMFLCKLSLGVFHLLTLSFPEAILYTITFRNIIATTKAVAANGILKQEALKKRKQKNTLNIYLTFGAWIIQCCVNLFMLFVTKAIFGKNLHLHSILTQLQLTFNFTILPFLYVIVADKSIKNHLINREFKSVVILLLTL